MCSAGHRTEDWYPSLAVALAWNALGMALMVVGIAVFTVLYAFSHGGEAGGEMGVLGIAVSLVIFMLLIVLHEFVHGLTMGLFGARPEYGAGLYRRVMPYLCCTSPGHRFTRMQFAAVGAAPLVAISLVGALCVAFVPLGGWLVIPLGAHLGGCIGDVWFLGILASLPRGTVLEDLRTGVRISRPAF